MHYFDQLTTLFIQIPKLFKILNSFSLYFYVYILLSYSATVTELFVTIF